MKKLGFVLAALALLAVSAQAEIRSIAIKIFGMDWEVCAHAVRVSLKSVSGVDAVDVSLEKGLASVKMKPGNVATLKQLQEAITKNGFTMKPSDVVVAGKIVLVNGESQLHISGSNEVVKLIPDSAQMKNLTTMADKLVLVQGALNEAEKNKTPDTIRYRSITEEKWFEYFGQKQHILVAA